MKKAGMKTQLWLILSGLGIGAVNGFFGGGGGLLCVPVLSGVLKLPAKQAHATAILVILPLSAVSAAVYAFSGSWEWGTGLSAMAGITAGGILGALLLKKLPGKIIGVVFALMMIGAGIRMMI
jgi:uncharacterized membrane protein YfcA